MTAFTSLPQTDIGLSEHILNSTIRIQCAVFAFSHNTLKERFHALAMDKMHIYGIYILDVLLVTSSFLGREINMGDMFILIIYPVRLNYVYFV